MTKLVILSILEGDFDTGFPVWLFIGEEGDRPSSSLLGQLPPLPGLPRTFHDWQTSYRALNQRSRLYAPPSQVTNVSIDEAIQGCQGLGEQLRLQLRGWYESEHGKFGRIREKMFQELRQSDEIRVLVQTDHPELRRLPWQLFFESFLDNYPKAEIALSPVEFRRVPTPVPERSHVRILAILGNSKGINVQADRNYLAKLPDTELEFLNEPARRELNDQLWSQGWDILFFAGHSASYRENQSGAIQINPEDSLNIDQVRFALREAIRGGLKLAIFNSCDGLGLARSLADLHLPQIIVMREAVPDRVAQEFLKQFLVAFADGQSLYTAVRQAREKLQALENEYPCATWLPVICQNPSTPPLSWKSLHRVEVEPNLLSQEHPAVTTPAPVGELFMVKPVGNAALRLEDWNLPQVEADVIVSFDDVDLSMGMGIAAEIREVGGEVIWEEAKRRVELGPLRLGQVIATTAGSLKARQVFHAVVTDRDHFLIDVDLIKDVTRKCLEMCNVQGWRSIAIPVLGAGATVFSPERLASGITLEVVNHLSKSTNLEEVTLALHGSTNFVRGSVARIYPQICKLLDLHQRVKVINDVLNDLDRLHRTHQEMSSLEMLQRYRQRVDMMQQRWTLDMMEPDASDSTGDHFWSIDFDTED